MLYGVGSPILTTTTLAQAGNVRTQEALIPPCIASFSLDADVTEIQAKCLKGGVIQTVASAITEKNYTMTINTEFVDWSGLQYAFDELAQVSAGVSLPKVKSAQIGATSFIDADLIGAAPSFLAYIDSTGAWGDRIFMEVVASAAAVTAPEHIHVNDATGEVTTFPLVATAVLVYKFDQVYTSIESIARESVFDAFGQISFSGELVSTEAPNGWQIVVPSMNPITIPSLQVNGDVATIETQYRLSVAPGFRSAYQLYNLRGAVI